MIPTFSSFSKESSQNKLWLIFRAISQKSFTPGVRVMCGYGQEQSFSDKTQPPWRAPPFYLTPPSPCDCPLFIRTSPYLLITVQQIKCDLHRDRFRTR
ncbi:hypothetical protein CEXT_510771 [Caerostris extrusa]|uniref:Uncharacterized protein n=1 Tax=Caerostris extrusa TaxID=172846 RepID=A0AAV4WQ71_CAEEX|nr:hypothetical protein CEXT_510771 [Caerostris extrusa]